MATEETAETKLEQIPKFHDISFKSVFWQYLNGVSESFIYIYYSSSVGKIWSATASHNIDLNMFFLSQNGKKLLVCKQTESLEGRYPDTKLTFLYNKEGLVNDTRRCTRRPELGFESPLEIRAALPCQGGNLAFEPEVAQTIYVARRQVALT